MTRLKVRKRARARLMRAVRWAMWSTPRFIGVGAGLLVLLLLAIVFAPDRGGPTGHQERAAAPKPTPTFTIPAATDVTLPPVPTSIPTSSPAATSAPTARGGFRAPSQPTSAPDRDQLAVTNLAGAFTRTWYLTRSQPAAQRKAALARFTTPIAAQFIVNTDPLPAAPAGPADLQDPTSVTAVALITLSDNQHVVHVVTAKLAGQWRVTDATVESV